MKHSLYLTTKNNKTELLVNGLNYCEKYLECLRSANSTIHLQTYIFELDDFGLQVYNELLKARARGIDVYVLVDAVGSRKLNFETETSLKNAGVNFFRFNSIHIKWLYRWGRRLHHKILIIDQTACIIGGINIHSPFEHHSIIPRLDFAVLVSGPIVYKLDQYCRLVLRRSLREKIKLLKIYDETKEYLNGVEVGISVNDWAYGHRKITEQYSKLTSNAQKDIVIVSSYFFPRKKFMKQLVAAVSRGVRVRLILPTFSDWPSYILASEYLYSYFLNNKIEIYQWKKSMLHGKLACIDGRWSTIGSYNLDYTSYQQNLEINVNIYSKEFTEVLNIEIENIISTGCDKIEPEKFLKASSFKVKISRLFFYLILSLVANFSIGLTFQEENNKENRIYNLVRVIGAILFLVLGVVGIVLPIIPGFPFFVISFLMVYRQIILNKART